MSSVWNFQALLAIPLLGAAIVLSLREPRTSAIVAPLFGALSTLQAIGSAIHQGSGFDAAIAVNAAMATIVLVAQPRRGTTRRDFVLPLLWYASSVLVMDAHDVRLIVVGWSAPPIITFISMRRSSARESRARRLIGAYLVCGSIPLILAAAIFSSAAAEAGRTSPFLSSEWHASLLSPQLQIFVFLLVTASVFIRLGVPPLHGWMPELCEVLPAGQMLALTSVQMSVHVMARLGIAPLPEAIPREAFFVQALGTLGVVYGAVMAASQQRLRRLVAYVAAAQSSALLVGLSAGDLISVTGALTNAISVAITSRGLMLVASLIESRVGPIDLRLMSGIAHPAPRLSATMLMLALAAAGLPGSLGFIGEDLLLQGLLHMTPVLAVTMVGSTAIIGIALLRATFRTCFGPAPSWTTTSKDLLPRERPLAVLGLIALLLGLWPAPLLRAHQDDVAVLRDAWSRDREAHDQRHTP